MARGQPGIADNVEVIDEKGAASLHRFKGNRCIPGAPANATKGVGIIGIGFSSDQFAVGGSAPIIGTAGTEEGARNHAKRTNQVAGIAGLKSGTREFQKKFLECLLRVRRIIWTRISRVACQSIYVSN